MEETKNPTDFKLAIERLIQHIKEYIETRYQLFILNVQEKSTEIVSSIASVFIIAILALLTLLFTSIGVSWYIGEFTGHKSVGFFCVSAFYLVILIFVYKFRDSLIKIPVSNFLVKKLTDDEED